MGIADMMEQLSVAVVTCDPDLKVTYANPKCKQVFKELLNMENFVGRPMAECHKPETIEKLKKLVKDYKDHSRKLDYYRMDVPGGKLTIVNVPFYEGKTLTGLMEFIFEDALA